MPSPRSDVYYFDEEGNTFRILSDEDFKRLRCYFVVKIGAKQYKVCPGGIIDIEHVFDETLELNEVTLAVVDGKNFLHIDTQARALLTKIQDFQGPKGRGFKYKAKKNQRKTWGFRQIFSRITVRHFTVEGNSFTKPEFKP